VEFYDNRDSDVAVFGEGKKKKSLEASAINLY
jgi:hypothetical protein